LLFERNWAKDHEDIAKKPNSGWSRFTDKINCAWKSKPICCQTHRINHRWQEAENRSEDRKTLNPLLIKRNHGKDHEDTPKSPGVSN